MAEILLSLTIIGVVAAITLPSLTGNINERTWNTQRKALYARMSQAIALMPSLNGYGTLKEESSSGANDAVDTAAKTFIADGLAKVLKINNICDSDHLEDCGIPQKIFDMNNTNVFSEFPKTLFEFNSDFSSANAYTTLDTKAAAFETANGEKIVVYYNPYCRTLVGMTNIQGLSYPMNFHPAMCVNFIYDLNGSKGPNTIGKDIGFISALYPSDSVVVAPMPSSLKIMSGTISEASKTCGEMNPDSRLPSLEELASLYYNRIFWGEGHDVGQCFWAIGLLDGSCFKYGSGSLWPKGWAGSSSSRNIWCIKR